MSYSLVIFTASADPIQQEYMSYQQQAITNSFPDLAVELQNEFDARWPLYANYLDRFPALILFYNGARKVVLHGKYPNEYIINWLRSNLS